MASICGKHFFEMFTFFQNQFTSFDFQKISPNFSAGDGDDFWQRAGQKHAALAEKINAARISPGAKEKFRRDAELVLQKNNPLEQLHNLEESLRKFEEFVLGMRTNFLQKRDGFLNFDFDGIPFWGGARVDFENQNLPKEAVEEKIFWLNNFVEPLFDEQSDSTKIAARELSATKTKMGERIRKIETESERRKKQIADFLAIHKKNPALATQFKKLFSKKKFATATFEERRNILLRIGDQIRIDQNSTEFLGGAESDFSAELESKISAVQNLSPSAGWVVLRDEEKKLKNPPRQLKKLEIFETWAGKFSAARVKIEKGISAELLEISRHLAAKKGAAVLKKDLEFVAKLDPQFKLEASIRPKPIPLELELLARLKISGESADEPTSSVRENLFLAQRKNEFIRRMFIQIAALAMAFGKTSTANETQKSLVKQDAVTRENLKFSETENLRQTAARQTDREIRGAETPQNVDTLGAAQNSGALEIRGGRAEIRAEEQSKFQTDSWEMTRLMGIKAWPPHQLQEYLQTVRRSGHRLEITNDYLPLSSEFGMNLLKQRFAANLAEMPGGTAHEKMIYLRECFKMVDSIPNADDAFVDRIFSYTPNE